MINASTPDGRGQDRPKDAEPFFPSEGSFNAVVPLSEVGDAPAAASLPAVNPADVGRPAEAGWAREAHRAEVKEEEETTLVPSRGPGAPAVRRSWFVTAAVIVLSVTAGLASGTYLIWSTRRAPEAPPPAQVAAEAPSLPPAPAAEQAEAAPKVEEVKEPVKDSKPNEAAKGDKPSEVAKAEKSVEAARPPKQAPPPPPAPATRAERVARAAAEARETTPAPKPARTRSAAPARARLTTAARQTPAPPISSPPPTAKSKKVIQWP